MTQDIEFRNIGSGTARAIIIDGVEWGTAIMADFGQIKGASFNFRDAANRLIRHQRDEGADTKRRSLPAPYAAVARKKSDIDAELHAAVVRMLAKGDLREPELVKAEAAELKTQRDNEIKKAEDAKNRLWKRQAVLALQKMTAYRKRSDPAPEDINAVIEAMRWAQTQ